MLVIRQICCCLLYTSIPDYEQSRFGELDKYESDYTVFNILGIEVWIEDDQLSEAPVSYTHLDVYKRQQEIFVRDYV